MRTLFSAAMHRAVPGDIVIIGKIQAGGPDNMLTVYIWNGRGPAWGHASMMVTGGNPPGEAYISYWPETPATTRLYHCAPATRQRTLQQDVEGEDGNQPDHAIQLNGLYETGIKSRWAHVSARRNVPGYEWCSTGLNCSAMVVQSLVAGGADRFYSGITWSGWNVIWDPAGVLSYVQALQRAMAQQRPIDWEAALRHAASARDYLDNGPLPRLGRNW